MIAAISPADYDETLSTLRYADQAKKIKNKAVINEDPNAKIIRELKEELELLRERLHVYAPELVEQLTANSAYKSSSNSSKTPGGSSRSTDRLASSGGTSAQSVIGDDEEIEFADSNGNVRKMTKQEIVEQFQTSEKLLANLNETWEDKLKKTEQIQTEREKALEELGITVHKNNVGVYAPKKTPHLVNLNEDPLMSECLVYQLKPGVTRVGKENSDTPAEIRLSGTNIKDEHCRFENENGVVTLYPNEGSLVIVNGMRISEPRRLKSGYRIILGDYHLFRFNHPEEARRERERQRSVIISSGSTSTNGPPTPGIATDDIPPWPGSPLETHTLYSEPLDWSNATPEAVRSYYASEATIQNLRDDDLDKLYGDISRIRNARRSRPSSRATTLGCDDDLSSKDSLRNSLATTTVADSDALESVCTEATLHGPGDLEERFKAEREKLQKVIDEQRVFFENRISRMSMQLAMQQDGLSELDRKRAMDTIKIWKKLHYVSMAETLLTHAVILKEANIIAKQFGKEATYQFTIIEDGQFANPVSYWEDKSGALQDIEDDDDPTLVTCTKPCVGVRVFDRKHNAMYVWSLDKLKDRLEKMRNLHNFMDKPMYRKHLNWEDPFYEMPGRKYTFIGSAAASFRSLVLQKPYEGTVNIVCRTTGQIKGKLKMLISPVAQTGNTGFINTQDGGRTLQAGQHIMFEIRLLELTGLKEDHFTKVHVQFRLSSFGPRSARAEDKVFATEPVSGFGNLPIQLDYNQTLSVAVTESMVDLFTNGMVSFEIYGQAQPAALKHYQRWDEQRESSGKKQLLLRLMSDKNNVATTGSGVEYSRCADHLMHDGQGGLERRPEEELLAAEKHDVVARVQVCELMPNGKYVPVQVTTQNELDRGAFCLRQGLQRRINITLRHTSGRQFLWTAVSNVSLGGARLLDAKGRLIDGGNAGDVPIKMSHQSVVYNSDGTSELTAYGAWDSSQHECPFLNCVTASNSRVLLELKFQVEAEKCARPMQFSLDVAVQIQGRDKSSTSSALKRLLGSASGGSKRVLPGSTAVFSVQLKPPMTRRVSQLWRLNTASKYVRGEELLRDGWTPRGVSLVNDFKEIQDKIKRLEQVAYTEQFLTLQVTRVQPSNGAADSSQESHQEGKQEGNAETVQKRQEDLLRKVVELWSRKSKLAEVSWKGFRD